MSVSPFADNFDKYPDAGISGEIMAAALEQGNTASHEFGHALGLRHYNSMNDGFAGNADILPDGIMATGDFGLNREIWQSGLSDAGNGQETVSQDDIAVIGKRWKYISFSS
ncbi:MAG: hypothetical protein R3C17_20880 [Planctomycetaceae bacterium]